MSRKDEAVRLFSERFNCSQAIFTAYREPNTLDERTALKLATVLGAGVAGTGRELCGAVSGGLLAISLKHGRGDLASFDAKSNTYELGRELMEQFEARHGTCICEKLLGVNVGTPAGHQQAQQARFFETRCLEYVKSCADLLEKLL